MSTAHAADFSQTYTTDRRGEFVVKVSSPSVGPVTLTIQAGNNMQSFTMNAAAETYSISFTSVPSGPQGSAPEVTAKVLNSHGNPVDNMVVEWSFKNVKGGTSENLPDTTTGTAGTTKQTITFLLGSAGGERRTVEVTARVKNDPSKIATATVHLGPALPDGYIAYASEKMSWVDAQSYCVSQGGLLLEDATYLTPITGEPVPTGLYWSLGEHNTMEAYARTNLAGSFTTGLNYSKSNLYMVICE